MTAGYPKEDQSIQLPIHSKRPFTAPRACYADHDNAHLPLLPQILAIRLICRKSLDSRHTFVLQSKKNINQLKNISYEKENPNPDDRINPDFFSLLCRQHRQAYSRNRSFDFSIDFSFARNVSWESINGYYKASFIEHGKTLYAFYTADADFMGIATYLLSDRLPVSLQSVIKEKYKGYWITDLFYFQVNSTPGFLITLENADQKIMLKAEENKSWSLYSVVKKS